MKMEFSYKGLGEGITFSPVYPLMFVNAFKKLGYNAKLVRRPWDFEYEGVPADNYFLQHYQDLMEILNKLSDKPVYFTDLEIDYSNLDVIPDVYGTTTSAGCKFKCKFCPNKDVGFLERDKGIVLKELSWLISNTKYFEFFDNNVLLSKTFLEIVEFIPDTTKWGALINITEITPELKSNLKKMYDHGCRNIYLGLETLNEADLVYFGKPFAGKVDPKEFMRMLQDMGFYVFAFIIRGLPHETIPNFSEMTNYLKSNNILYGISRFFNGEEEVSETLLLPKVYLKKKLQQDKVDTWNNLEKFLDCTKFERELVNEEEK